MPLINKNKYLYMIRFCKIRFSGREERNREVETLLEGVRDAMSCQEEAGKGKAETEI